MAEKKSHWIRGTVKHPGAERKAAERAGMSTHAFMEEHRNDPGTAGKRARLGLTLENMHGPKRNKRESLFRKPKE